MDAGYPYNFDRRQSASGDDPSPWAENPDFSRLEYRLIYLMEADREAIKLRQAAILAENEGLLLYRAIDNLDEVIVMCYAEVTRKVSAEMRWVS